MTSPGYGSLKIAGLLVRLDRVVSDVRDDNNLAHINIGRLLDRERDGASGITLFAPFATSPPPLPGLALALTCVELRLPGCQADQR